MRTEAFPFRREGRTLRTEGLPLRTEGNMFRTEDRKFRTGDGTFRREGARFPRESNTFEKKGSTFGRESLRFRTESRKFRRETPPVRASRFPSSGKKGRLSKACNRFAPADAPVTICTPRSCAGFRSLTQKSCVFLRLCRWLRHPIFDLPRRHYRWRYGLAEGIKKPI